MSESVSRLATDLGGDLLRTALLGAASPVLDARYHIRKVLGRGVTGVVLSAYDERLKREVAIKVAPSSAASARMLEEARALARMQRPMFVVQVWEAASGCFSGSAFTGRVNYIAMELVVGPTLREWRNTRERTMAEVLHVYADLAVGLSIVHAHDMVHGDVKPDNVIMSSSGAPTLVDFGFAAHIHEMGATTRSEVMGTPPYMAPEVRQGLVQRESDVHAYAVALWEALTGEVPFTTDSVPFGLFGIKRLPGEHHIAKPLRRALKSAMRPLPWFRPSIVALHAAVSAAAESSRARAPGRRVWPRLLALGLLAASVVFSPEWMRRVDGDAAALLRVRRAEARQWVRMNWLERQSDPGDQAEAALLRVFEVRRGGTAEDYFSRHTEDLACFYGLPDEGRQRLRDERASHFTPDRRREYLGRLDRDVVSATRVFLTEHSEPPLDTARRWELSLQGGAWQVQGETTVERPCTPQ